MESRPNRRSFLKRSASLILIGAHRGTSAGASQPARLPALPKLDGDVLYDTAARRAAADDWGHYVQRAPRAVLNAASPADVAAIVAYANRHQLSIAMRGQGHCVHGQAQAFDGIVIDSTRLNAIGWPGGDRLDAQPGALWSAVAKAALERQHDSVIRGVFGGCAAANDRLVHRCMAAGGRIYPPFAPVLSRENWTRHYGPQVWQRFAAAKARFDPNNVLTPGAGVFVQPTV